MTYNTFLCFYRCTFQNIHSASNKGGCILKIVYLSLVQAPKEEPVTYPQQNGQILRLKIVHLKETLHQREVDLCVYSIPIFQLKSATF